MESPDNLQSRWDQIAILRGWAHVYYAFDVGLAINLDEADRRATAQKGRTQIQSRKRVAKYFEFVPAPVRLTQTCAEFEAVPGFKTLNTADALLFDFGAISVHFKIPIEGNFLDAIRLSAALYDHPGLRGHARNAVEQLVREIGPAISKPRIADHVEDYNIFQIEEFRPEIPVSRLLDEYPDAISSLLRADTHPLSREEVQDVVSHRISYGQTDLTLVDWNCALIFDTEADDIRAVLEFTNVALLEFSYLDGQMDAALDEFYEYFAKTRTALSRARFRSFRPELKKISQFQIDSAILFEGVTNALKLFGDVFLARLYRLSAKRLGLADWDASINRKLRTVESIYEKISDLESTRRMEILEWIIIALIAVSIGISFIPGTMH
ncbi:MAG: hypothetical protein HY579_00595 [Nitrospinae bacterium]|nr:hypothetical protein [Nitrospinota bacterium]